MLRIENSYIGELLELEEYFKVEEYRYYLKENLTKLNDQTVHMKIKSSFLILSKDEGFYSKKGPFQEDEINEILKKKIIAYTISLHIF